MADLGDDAACYHLPSPMGSAFIFFPAVGILFGCVQGYGEWKRRRRSGPQFVVAVRAFGLGAVAGAAGGVVAAVFVTTVIG